jgi:outer membrane protein OmpA-like peptidoglycan-associated protein
MFAVQTKNKSKDVAEGKQHGAAVSPREQASELNPVWQSLALRPFAVQSKLTVSQPDDPYEQEADRVADHVMRMATPLPSEPRLSFSSTSSPEAQRNCAACEADEEQIQRKEQSGAAEPAPIAPAIVDEGLSSPGRPLDTFTRTFMESRFGHDFSQVQVHENSRAATSANAINAKAYTLGSHIVFATGQYQPEGSAGRRLLAHELAHTVQQGGTGVAVQRDTEDFRVTQVQSDPVERTKGIAPRFFFEIEQSDFREDVPAEKAERDRLIAWATEYVKEHKEEPVRVTGRASQEGSRVSNTQLALARAKTVAGILRDHGVKVKDIKVDMSYAKHPVDYRFYRSVELGDPTCNKSAAQKTKDLADCEKAFTAAHGRAIAIANAAMDRIRPDEDPAASTTPPPAMTRDAVLARHFPRIPRATVLPLFEAVVKRLGEVASAAGHTCFDQCVEEEVCERAASAGADTPLRLCAAFYIPEFHAGLTTE